MEKNRLVPENRRAKKKPTRKGEEQSGNRTYGGGEEAGEELTREKLLVMAFRRIPLCFCRRFKNEPSAERWKTLDLRSSSDKAP